MTMMVRDEADVIVPTIEYHLDQGVDLIIVTDNGSVDGTVDILERYAGMGVVELHHDPVQRMQQGTNVTAMARRACSEHGADWVINGDADEFLVPLDRSLTVRTALERTPVALRTFTVPVVNLVGPPAERGSGVDRLLWRDHRTDEQLTAIGIHAQPTPNAIHVGDPDVRVSGGNHFVSLESEGQPDASVAMEVLHLPWRSWTQFERKVLNSGRAFEESPDLRPSPKHHGMTDYRRALAGRLHEAFHLRLPLEVDLGHDHAFVEDAWLARHLHEMVPRALLPDLLEEALDGSKDQPYSSVDRARLVVVGAKLMDLERERDERRDQAEEQRAQIERLRAEADTHMAQIERLRAETATVRSQADSYRRRAESLTTRVGELRATVRRLRERVKRLRAGRDAARKELARATAWVPVRADLVRVGRRVAGAARRRLAG